MKIDMGDELNVEANGPSVSSDVKPPEGNISTEYKDNSFNINGGFCDTEKAICLESAYKHYGKGKGKLPVLLGLDMNVEKGTIYGLLGT